MSYRVPDKRSMKVVVCTHCILNQNAKLEGIAGYPGMIEEVMAIIGRSGAGILQIPCPEVIYEGIGRFDKSVEQYRCHAFKSLSKTIASGVVDQIEDYLSWGYQIPAILAIDGSPTCGFNLTQSAPEWRGRVAEINWKPVRYVPRPGVFMGILRDELRERTIDIPIIGIPELPELGALEEALEKIEAVLG
jgi:predicted secreted protein